MRELHTIMLEHAGLKISERVVYDIEKDSFAVVYHCDALGHSFIGPCLHPEDSLVDSRKSAFGWFESYAAAHKDSKQPYLDPHYRPEVDLDAHHHEPGD